ncbi:MAG: BlaI/MecI/CopY family transcriptional regulator [Planctomycetia bacterium]|nr:BlaI/MecI/CopY family transcriptional regulator [Planctomycetia bacterium]
MADMQRPAMSDAEREVLKVLWDHGPLTVRDVRSRLTEQGQEWSRSTVITLLQRLEKKGYVDSDNRQFAFVFRAIISREEVIHSRMNDLAGELCDGDALPLVLAFTERHRFAPDELARFRKMIDELEVQRGKRGAK